jgi:hypothetical protein
MIKLKFAAFGVVAVWAVPLLAEPMPDQHLPGERIGGATQDDRVNRRVDTRLPTRLETRIERRGALDPLAKTTSVITAAPTNGCATAGSQPAPACPPR